MPATSRATPDGAVHTSVKNGDRVRVVLEGEATWVGPRGFFIGNEYAANRVLPRADHVVSVEVLPPPEPEWKPGDVVRDATGFLYERGRDEWLYGGECVQDDGLVRPLTRLVPEGQS